MAMIALKCPHIEVVVVDISQPRIDAWNSSKLPIYEPRLDEVVLAARGRNLFFSTDVKKHIAEADVVFVRCAPNRAQPAALCPKSAPALRAQAFLAPCPRPYPPPPAA
jgi:UDP-glucose 6-dehydrogenase